MSEGYKSVDIICPYWVSLFESKRYSCITCEGLYPSSYEVTEFQSRKQRESHIEQYCKCKYNDCLLAKALNKKYEV